MNTTQNKKVLLTHIRWNLPIYFSGAIVLVGVFAALTQHAIAATGSTVDTNKVIPIWQILKEEQGHSVRVIWGKLLDLVNYGVVAVLIFSAFATMLRLNVNTYGIKKILPNIIFAVIAANFSFIVCRILIDAANVLLTVFVQPDNQKISGMVGGFSVVKGTFPALTDKSGLDEFFFPILQSILTLAGAAAVAVLAYLWFARNYILQFMIALAPLAFMATAIPQGKGLFNKWWGELLRWTFMPVISVFWLWIGSQWFNSLGDNTGWLLPYIFAGVCFYLAIRTPFQVGGSAGGFMNKWASTGKNVWNATGGAGVNAAKKGMSDWAIDKRETIKDKAWRDRPWGQYVTKAGMKRKMERDLRQKAREKKTSNLERQVYYDKYKKMWPRKLKSELEELEEKERRGQLGANDPIGQSRLNEIRNDPNIGDIRRARSLNKDEGTIYSRLVAANRGEVGKERETFAGQQIGDLMRALRDRKALNANGELLSEGDLTKLDADSYYEVRAALDAIKKNRDRIGSKDALDILAGAGNPALLATVIGGGRVTGMLGTPKQSKRDRLGAGDIAGVFAGGEAVLSQEEKAADAALQTEIEGRKAIAAVDARMGGMRMVTAALAQAGRDPEAIARRQAMLAQDLAEHTAGINSAATSKKDAAIAFAEKLNGGALPAIADKDDPNSPGSYMAKRVLESAKASLSLLSEHRDVIAPGMGTGDIAKAIKDKVAIQVTADGAAKTAAAQGFADAMQNPEAAKATLGNMSDNEALIAHLSDAMDAQTSALKDAVKALGGNEHDAQVQQVNAIKSALKEATSTIAQNPQVATMSKEAVVELVTKQFAQLIKKPIENSINTVAQKSAAAGAKTASAASAAASTDVAATAAAAGAVAAKQQAPRLSNDSGAKVAEIQAAAKSGAREAVVTTGRPNATIAKVEKVDIKHAQEVANSGRTMRPIAPQATTVDRTTSAQFSSASSSGRSIPVGAPAFQTPAPKYTPQAQSFSAPPAQTIRSVDSIGSAVNQARSSTVAAASGFQAQRPVAPIAPPPQMPARPVQVAAGAPPAPKLTPPPGGSTVAQLNEIRSTVQQPQTPPPPKFERRPSGSQTPPPPRGGF